MANADTIKAIEDNITSILATQGFRVEDLSVDTVSINFNALSQTARNWTDMAAAPNGNIYACVFGGDIYMQTNGAGNFNALSQTSRGWRGMAAAPNGNIYACVFGGDIYMQTNGTGNFNALSQTSRAWTGMAAAPNGNVYACDYGGDIYMQTGGTGNFNALSQTSRAWTGMAAAPNGNGVYVCVNGGDIYMQGNAFTPLAVILHRGEEFGAAHGQRPLYNEINYELEIRLTQKYPSTSRDKIAEWAHKVRENITVNGLNIGALATTKLVSWVNHNGYDVNYTPPITSISYKLMVRYREG